MATVGISQGVTGAFAVLQDYGIPPEGEIYVCDTVASRGDLVAYLSEGHCSVVSAAMPTTAWYLGFIEQQVVADNSAAINFGYTAQQYTGSGVGLTGDAVAIWRVGRYRVTNVSGSITAGAKVYPAASGAVSASQTASAPAVGVCTLGNTGSGKPIEMEILLIGKLSL